MTDSYDIQSYYDEIRKRNDFNKECLKSIREKIIETGKYVANEIIETGNSLKFYSFEVGEKYRISIYYTDFDSFSGNIHRIPGVFQVWKLAEADEEKEYFYNPEEKTSACGEIYQGKIWLPYIKQNDMVLCEMSDVTSYILEIIVDVEREPKQKEFLFPLTKGLYDDKRSELNQKLREAMCKEKMDEWGIKLSSTKGKYKDIQWIQLKNKKNNRVVWITFWKIWKEEKSVQINYGDICIYDNVTCTEFEGKRRYGLSIREDNKWKIREKPDEEIGCMDTPTETLVEKIIYFLKKKADDLN